MSFVLTTPTISAFFLGILSSFGVLMLVKLWRFCLRESGPFIVVAVVATGWAVAAWVPLFRLAYEAT